MATGTALPGEGVPPASIVRVARGHTLVSVVSLTTSYTPVAPFCLAHG
jgi:hypothetical protein